MVAVAWESSTDTTALLARIALRTGVPPDVAERILPGILYALGAHLSYEQRQLVADELPPALGAVLLMENVQLPRTYGMTDARMRTFVAITCSVLIETLSPRAVGLLRTNTNAPSANQPLLAVPQHSERHS